MQETTLPIIAAKLLFGPEPSSEQEGFGTGLSRVGKRGERVEAKFIQKAEAVAGILIAPGAKSWADLAKMCITDADHALPEWPGPASHPPAIQKFFWAKLICNSNSRQ
uniref:DUF982 domain-containing protein n=1 Tax=Ascaris lumbricoides TaxID=6252 RepID=A0A0M3HSH2_ASCLU